METLPAFLKARAVRHLRHLLAEIEGLSVQEALRFRRDDWPDHRWGIGQNGSIAGIVYHVAAWKQLTLPFLLPGGQGLTRADFDPTTVPSPDDWKGICAWLRQIGEEWNSTLETLPEGAFEENREFEGATFTLAGFVVEMVEHDLQHMAQIEYLRQRLAAES